MESINSQLWASCGIAYSRNLIKPLSGISHKVASSLYRAAVYITNGLISLTECFRLNSSYSYHVLQDKQKLLTVWVSHLTTTLIMI